MMGNMGFAPETGFAPELVRHLAEDEVFMAGMVRFIERAQAIRARISAKMGVKLVDVNKIPVDDAGLDVPDASLQRDVSLRRDASLRAA